MKQNSLDTTASTRRESDGSHGFYFLHSQRLSNHRLGSRQNQLPPWQLPCILTRSATRMKRMASWRGYFEVGPFTAYIHTRTKHETSSQPVRARAHQCSELDKSGPI
eukprot:6187232-Pleurochrysis_carterae.AAC.1